MSDQEGLRQTALKDSDLIASKRRFGLFSQPVSTAVGDNGGYKKKMRKDVLTKIREILKLTSLSQN